MIHSVSDLIADNTPWIQFDWAKNSLPENGGFPGTQFVLDPFRSAHKYGMDRDHYSGVRIQEQEQPVADVRSRRSRILTPDS